MLQSRQTDGEVPLDSSPDRHTGGEVASNCSPDRQTGTFRLQTGGGDVHSLLTLSTAHQEAGHCLPGQKRIGLRYLRGETLGEQGEGERQGVGLSS